MVWTIDSVAGGSLLQCGPIYSQNEKYMFICQGANVRMYEINSLKIVRTFLYTCSMDGTVRLWDIQDGKCLQIFNSPENQSILCMEQHPLLSDRLFICTKINTEKEEANSNIEWKVWEFSKRENKPLRFVIQGEGYRCVMKSRALGPMFDENNVIIASTNDNSQSNDVESNEHNSEYNNKKKRKEDEIIANSKSLPLLIITSEKTFYIFNMATNILMTFHSSVAIYTLDIHPTDNYFATGDISGHITLWYMGGNEKKGGKSFQVILGDEQVLQDQFHVKKDIPDYTKVQIESQTVSLSSTSLHWHSTCVHEVRFSPRGDLLYSVGNEGVLVSWVLKTFDRSFLPRICDGIKYVTINSNGTKCIISGMDNSIRIIDLYQHKVDKVIRSIGIGALNSNTACKYYIHGGILYDPNSDNLCIPLPVSMPVFQVYNIKKDLEEAEIGSEGLNIVSSTDNNRKGQRTIDFFKFSYDGQILYLLEKWNNGSGIESNILKFYNYKVKQEGDQRVYSTQLFAQIDNPHNDRITSIAVHPRDYIIVTGSKDGSFRIWKQVPISSPLNTNEAVVYGTDYTYACIYENTYREEPIGDCSFSVDGSLLAVTYGSFVTLWNTNDMTFVTVLSHPPPSYNIRYISFFNSTTSLLCSTDDSLYLYDVITKRIQWFVKGSISRVATNYNVHTQIPMFAAAINDEKDSLGHTLAFFSPSSPIPLCSYKLNSRVLAIEWAGYKEKDILLPCLYILTSRKEIICFKDINIDNISATTTTTTSEVPMSLETIDLSNDDEQDVSAYDKVFGIDQVEKIKQQLKQQQNISQLNNSTKDFQSILSVPSHTLPTPSLLFQSYADKILKQ
ncbi:hypothetical protein WA158_006480 [Blastocystis sp. Blastoise]